MKKIITLILLFVVLTNESTPQTKVHFSLVNRTISAGILSHDILINVPYGQYRSVGSSNIRIHIRPNPLGSLTVHPDNSAINANPNFGGVNGYQPIQTIGVYFYKLMADGFTETKKMLLVK